MSNKNLKRWRRKATGWKNTRQLATDAIRMLTGRQTGNMRFAADTPTVALRGVAVRVNGYGHITSSDLPAQPTEADIIIMP